MAKPLPLPLPDVLIADDAGRITRDWYDYLQQRDQLKVGDLRDISTIAPTNGQVLIYNATTKLWVPGAN